MSPFNLPDAPDPSRAADAARKAAEKARAALKGLRPPWKQPSPTDRAAAVAEVDAYLARVSKSRLGGKPQVARIRSCLIERVARGESVHVLRDELAERSRAEVARRQQLVTFANQLAMNLRSGDRLRRFRDDVMRPAATGRIGGRAAWEQTNEITALDVLRTVFMYDPGVTICMGLAGEGGLGVGAEASSALGGMLHKSPCILNSVAVAVGAYAEVSVSLQISFNQGAPSQLGGVAAVVGGGGGAGVSAGVGVSWAPVKFEPSDSKPPGEWITWKYDGLSVDFGVGGGLEISLGIEGSEALMLAG